MKIIILTEEVTTPSGHKYIAEEYSGDCVFCCDELRNEILENEEKFLSLNLDEKQIDLIHYVGGVVNLTKPIKFCPFCGKKIEIGISKLLK